MVHAVFFDIDGTLTNSQGRVFRSTREALSILHEQGILTAVATGRGPDNLLQQLNGLRLDGYVLYNGQYVLLKDQVIYENPFPTELVEKIAQYGEDNKLQMLFGTDTDLIGSRFMRLGHNRWIKQISRVFRKYPSGLVGQVASKMTTRRHKMKYTNLSLASKKVYQVVMMLSDDEEGTVANQFPECTFTRSNPLTVDIIPRGVSKVVGIKKLLDAHSIGMNDAVAFGDSWNDIDMIESVGTGIAMGNANEDVKKVAQFVTLSNDRDGISGALKKLGII